MYVQSVKSNTKCHFNSRKQVRVATSSQKQAVEEVGFTVREYRTSA
uniref:Uncharacterized protein n=1 Tax=Setaria italica TaxID=4555 RepID=K4A4F5_SETIT